MQRTLSLQLRQRIPILLTPLITLLVVVGCVWQADHQERLNQALFAAIRDDDTPKAIRLLNSGADAISRDHGQRPQTIVEVWTALWQRFRSGQTISRHPTPLTKMLAAGNAPDDGEQLVRALLDHCADPNDRDDLGYGPLSLALIYHREDIARLLVEHGAEVNSTSINGDTPLMLDYGDPEMPGILLRHGAQPKPSTPMARRRLSSPASRAIARRRGSSWIMARGSMSPVIAAPRRCTRPYGKPIYRSFSSFSAGEPTQMRSIARGSRL
jgi:hypothetical protein